jgi:glycerophosphoryl diester phosphodiesterase
VGVLAIAHRAGNTLAGLRAATSLGVDVIECDVHQHRGRLEVRHLKTAGPLPFLWDTWELASASAPRLGLGELLDADERGTPFMLDLKGRRTSAAHNLATLLHERAHDVPLLVCGRHWPSVDVLGELSFVRRILSARNRSELSRLHHRLAGRDGPYGVSVHKSLLDTNTVSALKDQVEVVMTWPVNDLNSLDMMLGMGVTGVISDELDVLAELIGRRR